MLYLRLTAVLLVHRMLYEHKLTRHLQTMATVSAETTAQVSSTTMTQTLEEFLDLGAALAPVAEGLDIESHAIGSASGDQQDRDSAADEAEFFPELCCVCLTAQVTHALQPCGRKNFCRDCVTLILAGAVSEHAEPQCPICRAPATDSSAPRSLGRVPGSQLVAVEGGLSASGSGPTETASGVTLNIHQDVLSIIRANVGEASRRTSRETDEMRTLRLIRQVTELRHVHSVNYAHANYARRCDEHDEPLLLPDAGAADGLCGDRWAIHAGRWAKNTWP